MGIRLVATFSPEQNKIIGMIPVGLGFLGSIIFNRDLWKKCSETQVQ
jgi:hypothetical protein